MGPQPRKEPAIGVVPERHPGVKATHPTGEKVAVYEYPFALNTETLAGRGLTTDDVARALWAAGNYERRQTQGGWALRSFQKDDAAALSSLSLRVRESEMKTSQLGDVGAPAARSLRVG